MKQYLENRSKEFSFEGCTLFYSMWEGYKKEKNTTKPELGVFKKAGITPKRFLREFKVENPEEFSLGQEIKLDVLEGIEFIDGG